MSSYIASNGATDPGVDLSTNHKIGIGIGTTSPTNALSLSGNSAQTIWMEQNTTASSPGNSLTLQAGGSASSSMAERGGDLILSSGISTGDNTSNIYLQTVNGNGPILNVASTPTNGGSGYVVNDVLSVSGGTNGQVTVAGIQSPGNITGLSLVTFGSGYSFPAPTTNTATGCTVNITSISNGVITGINSTPPSGGGGYEVGDILTVTGNQGQVQVTSVAPGGVVTGLSLYSGGSGYVFSETTTGTTGVTGSGCIVNISSISGGTITGINSTPPSGGTGYSVNNVLNVSGGTGGQVKVTAVSSDGKGTVTSFTLTGSGSGYSLTASTTGGSGCYVTINQMLGGAITGIASAPPYGQGGNGYAIGDILAISGGTVGAAQVQVTGVTGGAVTSLALIWCPGLNYCGGGYSFSANTTGGYGSNCTVGITSINSSGALVSGGISVLSGGDYYQVNDILTIQGGTTNATVQVTSVVNGVVTSVSFNPTTGGGSGYTVTGTGIPTQGVPGTGCLLNITTSGGAIQTASVNYGGSGGYNSGDLLTVQGGTGGQVQVVTTGSGGTVVSVSIYNPGSGYSNGTGIQTTMVPGTGCTINILSIGGTGPNIPNTQMTVLGNGNVGIGTTSPMALLHNAGDFITKGPWHDVRAYGVLSGGSTQTTTGSITVNTNSLIFANSIDFQDGQGICIRGAGSGGTDLITTIVSGCGTTATNGQVNNGTTNLNVTSVVDFQVNQGICVKGAGSGGTDLITTITNVNPLNNILTLQNATQYTVTNAAVLHTAFTLAASAGNSVTNAQVLHDDSSAIQGVVDAAWNRCTAFLPSGTYYVTKTIQVHGAMTLAGANRCFTNIVANIPTKTGTATFTHGQTTVTNISPTSGVLVIGDFIKATGDNFEMRGEIVGISTDFSTVTLADPYMGNTYSSTTYATISPVLQVRGDAEGNFAGSMNIRELLITSLQTQAQVGIDVYRSQYVNIENVNIQNMYVGIYLSTEFHVIKQPYILNCRTGVQFGGITNPDDFANTCYVYGGWIAGNTEYGVRFVYGESNVIDSTTIEANVAGTAVAGVSFEGPWGNCVTGCHIECCCTSLIRIDSPNNVVMNTSLNQGTATDLIKWISHSGPADGNHIFGNRNITDCILSNLGVGTTSPSEKLHIADTGDPAIRLEAGGGANGYICERATTSSPASGLEIINAANGPLTFQTNNSERARIDASGNFGLGVTMPDHRLSVSDTAHTTQAIFGQDITSGQSEIAIGEQYTNGKAFNVGYDHSNKYGYMQIAGDNIGTGIIILQGASQLSGENVGINTTSPHSKLQVNGSIGVKVVSKGTAYTAADEAVILVTAAVAITLPSASTVTGRMYYIKKAYGTTGTVTINAATGDTIDGASSQTLTGTTYPSLRIVSDGTTKWWILDRKS